MCTFEIRFYVTSEKREVVFYEFYHICEVLEGAAAACFKYDFRIGMDTSLTAY